MPPRGHRKLSHWKDGETEALRGVMPAQGPRPPSQDPTLPDQPCGEHCGLASWQPSMEGRGGGTQPDTWRLTDVGSPRFADQRGARAALTLSFVAASALYLLLAAACSPGLPGVALLFASRLPAVLMHTLPGRALWGQVRTVRTKYRPSGLWQAQGW